MGYLICNFSVALYTKNNQVKLTKLLILIYEFNVHCKSNK